MRISSSLERACCILALLASHRGTPVTNAELNTRMGISPSYLTKITRKLVVGNLIQSTQGVKGGYILARPLTDITLGSVVEVVEGHEPFFHSSGLIERVFPSPEVTKGMQNLERAFTDAEVRWRRKLNSINVEQILHRVRIEL